MRLYNLFPLLAGPFENCFWKATSPFGPSLLGLNSNLSVQFV